MEHFTHDLSAEWTTDARWRVRCACSARSRDSTIAVWPTCAMTGMRPADAWGFINGTWTRLRTATTSVRAERRNPNSPGAAARKGAAPRPAARGKGGGGGGSGGGRNRDAGNRPVPVLAATTRTGAATVVLSGIGVGFESAVYTAGVIAAAICGVFLLASGSIDLGEEFSLLKVLNMKTTARNQFLGTVSAVRSGAVNDEVELTLPTGMRLVAIVTRESTQALGLRTQLPAIALVQASHVLLATGLGDARLSARNQLHGVVHAVNPGAVNAEVLLDIDGGGQIVAIVTQASVAALGLVAGVRATALVKASDVILAVTV